MTNPTKTKWFLPAFCVGLGVAVFAAQWIGGDARSGAISFAWLAGFGGLILFGGRSETPRGLRGGAPDERVCTMDIPAPPGAGGGGVRPPVVALLGRASPGDGGGP